jgi:NAD(P)-dependent dehydrogenase (short-subunit alcohol dehydrogenase family)
MTEPLEGHVALVTGSTRGAGRGMAIELGAAGATVYVTGRTTRESASPVGRTETIEDTAELVTAAGGRGIAVRCDHLEPSDARALADRIESEQDGRLDVLVDDTWGGDQWIEWTPIWEHDLDNGLRAVRNGLDTHLITLHTVLPLLVRRGRGLVVEITDGDDRFNSHYRESMFYDLVKVAITRMGKMLSEELQPHGVTSVALTPGFLRSEAVLDHFGVTEDDWRDGIAKDKVVRDLGDAPLHRPCGRRTGLGSGRRPVVRSIAVVGAARDGVRLHRPRRLAAGCESVLRRRVLRRPARRRRRGLPLTGRRGCGVPGGRGVRGPGASSIGVKYILWRSENLYFTPILGPAAAQPRRISSM